jgi:hypothetical protein
LARCPTETEIEAVARKLIALIEEFEETLGESRATSLFAKRLGELRQTAERLIGP